MVDQDGSMTKLPREVVARYDVAIGTNLPEMARFTARPIVAIGVGDTVAPSKAQIHGKIHPAVGQTETGHPVSGGHHNMVVVKQRGARDAPSVHRRADLPGQCSVVWIKGSKLTVGPTHEQEGGP